MYLRFYAYYYQHKFIFFLETGAKIVSFKAIITVCLHITSLIWKEIGRWEVIQHTEKTRLPTIKNKQISSSVQPISYFFGTK